MRRVELIRNRIKRGAATPLIVVTGLSAVFLMLMLAPPTIFAQKSAQPYPTVEPRKGEICLVCDRSVEATDRVYEVDGQRVPVHEGACDEVFKQTPDRYLAKMKPRGAFLGAEPSSLPNLSPGWLLSGLYVLLGVVFAGVCAYGAVNRLLSPVPWFFAGLFFNLFAYLALILRPRGDPRQAPSGVPHGLAKVPMTYSPQACPTCGETNHPSAIGCSACRSRLEPRIISEVVKSGL